MTVFVDSLRNSHFFSGPAKTKARERRKINCWLSTISLRPRYGERRKKNDVEIKMWWTICIKNHSREWHVVSKIGNLVFPPDFLHSPRADSFVFAFRARNAGTHVAIRESSRPFVKVTFNYRKLAKHSLVSISSRLVSLCLAQLLCEKMNEKKNQNLF